MFASLALDQRSRSGAFSVAFMLAWLLVGCASVPGTSLIDELRTADLSAKHPQHLKEGALPGSKQKFEAYPGDDNVYQGTAGRSASAGRTKQVSIQKVSNPASSRAGDGYQLNFDGASLAEVAKVVLGDTLKLPYHHDPRVQGQITLSTARPVSADELLSVLESALKIHNAVLMKADGGYRIAPAADAMTGDTGGVLHTKGEPVVPGFGVSVLPLRNISAEAAMRLLENFLSKGGMLRAETTGNLLLVRGTATDRQSLMEVAASFDTDWLKGQSAGIFPLNHTTPDELIGDLTGAMRTEQGDLLGKMIRFQPLHRLNAVLVLAHQSNQLQQAAEWIRRLDRSSEAGESLHVYRVQNGRARDLAALLNETLGNAGTGSRKTPPRSDVAPGRDIVALTSKSKQPSSGPLIAAANAKKPVDPPPVVSEASPPGKTAQGSPSEVRISADEANNLLLILARAGEYRRIATVLRQIDRPPLQVMINATIVEVTLNDSLRYGVQVFLKGKNVSGGFVNASEIPLAPSVPGLNFISGSLADPKIVLDALANVTEVKIVSSPSVVVVDNQPAVLKVGDEVPISTQQATILENPNAPVVNSIRFRDTGIILKVVPRVNSNGLVTMDVEQEMSAVADQGGGPSLTPTISQRQVASTISVYSGQMVVLGGLISEQRNNDKNGVPFLNKLPVLGDVLGSTSKGAKRTELIVFIRPQVIRDSRDAQAVAEELRSRLKSMAPAPLPGARRQ